MKNVRITHVGGPTALIEVGGWHLLTDRPSTRPASATPSAGGRARASSRSGRPQLSELPPIDAVLLSHDHHDDNLDPAGRALLPSAGGGDDHVRARGGSATAHAGSSRGRRRAWRLPAVRRSRSPPRPAATVRR